MAEATLYVPEASLNVYQTTEQWQDFSTIKPITGTGLSLLNAEGYRVFPVPAVDFVTVEVPAEVVGQTAYLMDLNGRMIAKVTLNEVATRIDVSGIASGTYMLRVGTMTKKVVVK